MRKEAHVAGKLPIDGPANRDPAPGRVHARVATGGARRARRRIPRGPRFFLSPYPDEAFTRCPRCDRAPTRVRKVYLVVLVEHGPLMNLNKVCRLCVWCDLLIVKQAELERLMAFGAHQHDPSVVGNPYHVLGVLDRQDGRETVKANLLSGEIRRFREVLDFRVVPRGWVRDIDPPGRSG